MPTKPIQSPEVIYLNDEDYDEFIRVMTTPARPTQALLDGAKFWDELYHKKTPNACS